MTKQTKEQEEPRKPGPKFGRSVLPENFQIRRSPSPMAEMLEDAERRGTEDLRRTPEKFTPVDSTPVNVAPVKSPVVDSARHEEPLPEITIFLDVILPRFPPARQSILLRLYRWSEGWERELVVSTPRLAAKTNMDEKSCRAHLHALIADGYVLRSMEGEHHARFGGNDRTARGLILRLSASALADLVP
ncbi:MAG: hypothetical protein H0W99_04735 [Acidobacteria bacterium]|nr:hypothetical protein [Acidobacteriota bacterium]